MLLLKSTSSLPNTVWNLFKEILLLVLIIGRVKKNGEYNSLGTGSFLILDITWLGQQNIM
jgi:hypothetical protein